MDLDLHELDFLDGDRIEEPQGLPLHLNYIEFGSLSARTAEIVSGDLDASIFHVGRPIVWDIETGPLPANELEMHYTALPDPGPFNDNDVKLGNLKDPVKIAEKIGASRRNHINDWEAKCHKHRKEFMDRAALSAVTGRIIAIGYRQDELRVIHAAEEPLLIAGFYKLFRRQMKSNSSLVGHNCHKFDVPFIRQRGWRHRSDEPAGLYGGRFVSDCIVDTSREWSCGVYGADFIGLGTLAMHLGVGGKPAGAGARFAELWESDRDAALQYLADDLDLTWGVAEAMNLLR